MKKSVVILLLLITSILFAQEKKTVTINRTNTAPKIDGVLDDVAWENAEEAKDFTQFRPEMGVKELDHQKTIVKMVYNDNAIFISAYLHDKPEDIMKQFTSRDNFGISDFFGIVINPNNDGQNDTEFFIFPSGTQADAVVSPGNNEDFGWNAVWDSATKIVDDGWIIEVKIPYSALRFSNQEVQTWGFQFHRRFRTNNSQYSWNPIDRTKGYIGSYAGLATGIKNIEPPTRLSFYPFASANVKSFDGETEDEYSIGMDVKYGITENFTLDVTLIPDFSQAAFDNVQLNLGPFEQQFSEQRQFFKEGVDLFNKGNLFYSRRIGGSPSTYPDVSDDEEVIDYPGKVTMLNALKVSGRTKKGLGIGFFNAITEKTNVEIRNTNTGETRNEIVEPFTNYNIFVLDQQFGENSSVSLVNTNVTRDGYFRDANVTGALFDISTKGNKYNISGEGKMSVINDIGATREKGFSSNLSVGKVSGKYRARLSHRLEDDKYNTNDLGIQFRNNFSNFSFNGSYRIFEPTETLNNFNINVWANYRNLYKPGTYTGNNVGAGFYAQTKKLFEFGGNINGSIGNQYDYWEPRTDIVERNFFKFKNTANINGWFETNDNKMFAFEFYSGMSTHFNKDRDVFYYWWGAEPRIRFSDKFVISYEINYEKGSGGQGYVTDIDDDIIFGEREQLTVENGLSASYNFNSYHALGLTFRNYWATVNYEDDLLTLQKDGSTIKEYTVADVDDPNVNFNTWNVDFRYSWQFAPGSQLTALYRNSLFDFSERSKDSYFDSIETLFKEPIEHVFSLRLVYYIDYNTIKSLLRKKVS